MIVKKLESPGKIFDLDKTQKIKSGYVVLSKGEDVGWHITEKREEVIVILEGKAEVILERESEIIKKGQVVYIPEGQKHNVKNNFVEDLKYIYIVSILT